jgi:predicted NAD-dependent protein-ADP-ribosyltransferase YbiA (DUF1768 family)
MVLSKINKEISYIETKKIEDDDTGHSSPIYSMPIIIENSSSSEKNVPTTKKVVKNKETVISTRKKIENFDVAVVLGKAKNKFTASKEVVYYPIYILSNLSSQATANSSSSTLRSDSKKKIHSQIGVFEIIKSYEKEILDEDGDIDLSKLDDPLLYEFVTSEFLVKINSNPLDYVNYSVQDESKLQKNKDKEKEEPNYVEVEDSDNEKDDDDENENDVLKLKVPKKQKKPSIKQAEDLLKDGIFIKNKDIKIPVPLKEETEIISTEIKKSYKEMTNHNWMQKFTKNINYGIIDNEGGGDCFFAVLRDAYKSIGKVTTVAKLRAILAEEATDEIFQENRNLFLSFENNKIRIKKEMQEVKKSLIVYNKRFNETSDENVEQKSKINKEKETLKNKYNELQQEYNETNQNQTDYIGTMKNIDTLEKFRQYIQTSSYWANEWAISTLEAILNVKIIILSEESYENNSYDNILNCGEVSKLIPENITDKIVGHNGVQYSPFHPKHYIMTCYTGNHYTLITYKNKHILSFQEIPYDIKIMIINKCLEQNSGIYYLIPEFRNFKSGLIADSADDIDLDDCDEDNENSVIFVYHSSALDAKIGKGNAEKINKTLIPNYSELNRMKEWRKKLDDMWIAPFSLEEQRWCSVENYLQGSKFKKNHTEFYKKFSLDSNSDISKDPKLAKQVGTQKSKRPKEIKIDPDYDLGRSEVERESAIRSKFQQNEDLKQILLATKSACIKHFQRGSPAIKDEILMKIRRELANIS